MKLLLTLIATVTLSLSVAANSQAQDTLSAAEGAPHSTERHGLLKRHHKKHMSRMGNAMFKRMDSNEDRKLDLNEFLNHSEQRFNMMDFNSDGYVTPEEARKAASEMRKKHHAAMREARKKRKHADEIGKQHDAELQEPESVEVE